MNKHSIFAVSLLLFISCGSNLLNENCHFDIEPPVLSVKAESYYDSTQVKIDVEAKIKSYEMLFYRAHTDIGKTPKDSDFKRIAVREDARHSYIDEDFALTIGKKYVYKAKCRQVGSESDFSDSKEIRLYPPNTPTNVKAEVVAPRSFRVTWDAVEGAEIYTVHYHKYNYSYYATKKVSTTSLDFTGYSLSSRDYCTVVANFCDGLYSGEESEKAYITGVQ